MSNVLIKTYFTQCLEDAGYPTDDINYSLNYCQGDGMAFYGDIEEDKLTAMANRHLSGKEKAAAKRAIEKGCTASITRNSFANRYSHYNTMSVDGETYYGEELTALEERSFDALIEAIAKDVVSVSKQLESDGYNIVEAGSSLFVLNKYKRTFETANYLLEIKEVEDEDFCINDWDEELRNDFIKSLVDEKQRYFCLKVTLSSHNGMELASNYLGGCTQLNDKYDRTYGGYLRQIVSKTIQEARDTINAIALPIAS